MDIADDSRSDVGQLPVVAIGNVAIHALLVPIHQIAIMTSNYLEKLVKTEFF